MVTFDWNLQDINEWIPPISKGETLPTLQDNEEYLFTGWNTDPSGYWNYIHGIQDCSRGNTYHNRKFKAAAEAHGLIVDHHEKYGWTITKPSDELLEVILKYDLTDILLNRNEFTGFQITGTGSHSGTGFVGIAPKKSSSRKYACPCCGMSIRATRAVNVACLDCDEQLLLVG